ncbi:uncharacterized protein N7479_004304 [Penicillium vulpinum]|uniref:uncharacterized protein n=1 Tax=Penicillium vulpinum TaxID=29845 RepID=UPI002548475E|nr:uncharacterized protein N7479_004304 [Penicillium vulpinum]KAJ5964428.1 hypothetical protein N7479_004304 [Penicillium vulpinum]
MSSPPDRPTARAYIIYASVSLTGRAPACRSSAPKTNICSFPNATTNEQLLHPRASDLAHEPCLWDLPSV